MHILLLLLFAAQFTPTEKGQNNDYPIPPGVYKVGKGIVPPKALATPNPKYPKEMKKEKIEGTVYVSCVIDEKGEVTNPKVTQGLEKTLDALALESAKKWKFNPATKDGQPVPVFLVIQISYKFR